MLLIEKVSFLSPSTPELFIILLSLLSFHISHSMVISVLFIFPHLHHFTSFFISLLFSSVFLHFYHFVKFPCYHFNLIYLFSVFHCCSPVFHSCCPIFLFTYFSADLCDIVITAEQNCWCSVLYVTFNYNSVVVSMLYCQPRGWGLNPKKFILRYLPTCSLANSAVMSTLTIHCPPLFYIRICVRKKHIIWRVWCSEKCAILMCCILICIHTVALDRAISKRNELISC